MGPLLLVDSILRLCSVPTPEPILIPLKCRLCLVLTSPSTLESQPRGQQGLVQNDRLCSLSVLPACYTTTSGSFFLRLITCLSSQPFLGRGPNLSHWCFQLYSVTNSKLDKEYPSTSKSTDGKDFEIREEEILREGAVLVRVLLVISVELES